MPQKQNNPGSRAAARGLPSVIAVAAGFTVFAVSLMLLAPLLVRAFAITLEQSPSPGYLFAVMGLTLTAAMASGFLTAKIAGRKEIPHAAAVGLLMVALGFWNMRRAGASQPGWSELTLAGIGPMAAMVGAALRMLLKSS